jgi:hypothetical protein
MMNWFRVKLSELFISLAVVTMPKGGRAASSLAACLELYLTLNSKGFAAMEIEK